MPLKAFITIPQNLREWSSWCRETKIELENSSVGTDELEDAAVTDEKLRDSAPVSVIGRASGTAGSPADIAASSNDTALQRISNVLVFAPIDASRVTFTPTGGISATFVDDALAELDSEKLNASAYTAADVLAKLLTVDGVGSALDADLLDGNSSAYFTGYTDTALSTHVGEADPHTQYALESALPVLASGTYTPTLANTANLDASTAYQCQYLRVGATVTVSGRVDVDPTLTATATQLGISLPVASNFGAVEDCAGAAFASGIAAQGAAVLADTANDRALMQWVSGDISNQAMYFTFTYQII